MWHFIKTAWYWRKKVKRNAIVRTIPFVIWGLVHFLGFTVAGLFSSRVTNTQSRVLISPGTCGLWPTTPTTATRNNITDANRFIQRSTDIFRSASELAATCGSQSSTHDRCNVYTPQNISWTTNQLETCPFESQMCQNKTSIRFDTGLLDSARAFGINAEISKRVLYRTIMECAPIERAGYMGNWTKPGPDFAISDAQSIWAPNLNDAASFLPFRYGPDDRITELGFPNTTMIFNNLSTASGPFNDPSQFSLEPSAYYQDVQDGILQFHPIKALQTNPNADLYLLFLAQTSSFNQPVYDPWFQALKPFNTTPITQSNTALSGQQTLYIPEWPVSVMGCTQQYQICNPVSSGKNPRCSPLSGRSALIANFNESTELSNTQQGVAWRILSQMSYVDFYNMVLSQPTGILLANRLDQEYVTLSNNHWIHELEHMFQSMLIGMQMWGYYYVTGDGDSLDDSLIEPPVKADRWMCNQQMIVRDDYSTFSVTGIVIIFVVGGVFILLRLCLDKIVPFIRRRWFKRNTDKDTEWDALETTVLQRLAYNLNGADMSLEPISVKPLLEKVVEFNQSRSQTTLGDSKQPQAIIHQSSWTTGSPTSPIKEPNAHIEHGHSNPARGVALSNPDRQTERFV